MRVKPHALFKRRLKMRATIHIQQDEQLRAAIKDMIKGEVKGMARKEIQKVLTDEIKGKIRGTVESRFNYVIDQEIRSFIQKELGYGYYSNSKSKRIIESLEKEMKIFVNDYFQQKKSFLEKQIIEKLSNNVSQDKIILDLVKKLTKK